MLMGGEAPGRPGVYSSTRSRPTPWRTNIRRRRSHVVAEFAGPSRINTIPSASRRRGSRPGRPMSAGRTNVQCFFHSDSGTNTCDPVNPRLRNVRRPVTKIVRNGSCGAHLCTTTKGRDVGLPASPPACSRRNSTRVGCTVASRSRGTRTAQRAVPTRTLSLAGNCW